MIDIHTHILPGIDDGARDLEEALAMARIAVADGTTHLFATPHHWHAHIYREALAERVAWLQAELEANEIPLTLLPGYEVRLFDDMLDDWKQGLAGPLGQSHYVLVEPLFDHYDHHSEAMIFELCDQGYIPIMAHPERIRPIQKDLALLEPFLARGGLVQLTSTSLSRNDDRHGKRAAHDMLQAGMAHIIASDAHGPYRRTPGTMAAARDAAALFVGPERAEMMVTANPLAVLNDEPLPPVKVVPPSAPTLSFQPGSFRAQLNTLWPQLSNPHDHF
jgi:protein-tyrosine phosphatase